jgi:tetratricopeptide (TPR) repeat protein
MMTLRIVLSAGLFAATVSLAHAAGPQGAPPAGEAPPVSAAVAACLEQSVDPKVPAKLPTTITVCGFAIQSATLPPLEKAAALEHRGLAHFGSGNLDKAVADLLAAKALAPDEPSIARMLGWTYRGQGRMAESEQEYDRALKLEAHWQGYLSRCVVRIDTKDYVKALSDCETAHQMQPSEDSTYFTGWLYNALKRPADAIKIFEAATAGPIEAGLASGRVYGELSNVYKSTGKTSDASRVAAAGRARFPADPNLALPPPRQ